MLLLAVPAFPHYMIKGVTMKFLPAALLSLLFVTSVFSQASNAQGVSQNISPALDQIMPTIDSMKRLPIKGVVAVSSKGKTLYMSDNGRFVFMEAQLYDTWNRQHLDSMAEIELWSDKIDLNRLGLDVSKLGALPYGHGDKKVVIYIDPHCPYCEKLLHQIEDMTDEYTFKLIVVPFLGERSAKVTRRLMCGLEQGIDRRKLANSIVKKAYNDLPSDSKSCDSGPVEKALLTAKLTGVQGVPFIIAENGTFQPGYVENLSDWLANVEKNDQVSSLENEDVE